jgi:hypothetical protein
MKQKRGKYYGAGEDWRTIIPSRWIMQFPSVQGFYILLPIFI